MTERGVVGIAVLWLILAVSALAFSVLSLGKWHQAHGRNQIRETKMICLAQMAMQLERDSNFTSAGKDHEFSTGRVRIERTLEDSQNEARVHCFVECGKNRKQIEAGWRRLGGEWRATHWREL